MGNGSQLTKVLVSSSILNLSWMGWDGHGEDGSQVTWDGNGSQTPSLIHSYGVYGDRGSQLGGRWFPVKGVPNPYGSQLIWSPMVLKS